MPESFHEWLRRNAKQKSRFFTRFAREAGINEKTFSKMIDGYCYPSTTCLWKIFKYLRTPEEERKEVVWKMWCEKLSYDSRR